MEKRWLSPSAFELRLMRPSGFTFLPGQHVRIQYAGLERDYSLVSGPEDPELALCIRYVPGGRLSPHLASLTKGAELPFTGPHGHFAFRASDSQAVFIATGTGIAPFVSMARAGVEGFILLHGVREARELCYRELLRAAAAEYIPCLSAPGPSHPGGDRSTFCGRVSACLQERIPRRAYDFYLCGSGEMIRDVTLLVDEIFPGSRVYVEIFFSDSSDRA